MADRTRSAELKVLFLRTIWIFQAILAGVIFVALGLYSLALITEGFYTDIYEFVRSFLSAILAGFVVLVVLIQRKISTTPKVLTRNCELGKSAVATIFWIWWFVDAFYGPRRGPNRSKVAILTAIASLLLFILFYPAAWYATFSLEGDDEEGRIRLDEEGAAATA